MHPDKRVMRAQLRAERDRFASESGGMVRAPQPYLDRLAPGVTVASYIAVGSEADPGLLASAAVEHGCRLVLPVIVDRASPIRFVRWDPGDALIPGSLGIPQPVGDAEADPDIILTPLVGFDQRLNRLGQGAGHYDRAFARFPDAWRLGVAWAMQQVPAVPVEMWDVPLHAVITEEGMLCHAEA